MNDSGKYNDEGGLENDVKELKRDVKETQSDVRHTKSVVHELRELLQGSPGSDKPSGLVHSVWRNTKFRQDASKIIWFLITIVGAIVIDRLFNLL